MITNVLQKWQIVIIATLTMATPQFPMPFPMQGFPPMGPMMPPPMGPMMPPPMGPMMPPPMGPMMPPPMAPMMPNQMSMPMQGIGIGIIPDQYLHKKTTTTPKPTTTTKAPTKKEEQAEMIKNIMKDLNIAFPMPMPINMPMQMNPKYMKLPRDMSFQPQPFPFPGPGYPMPIPMPMPSRPSRPPRKKRPPRKHSSSEESSRSADTDVSTDADSGCDKSPKKKKRRNKRKPKYDIARRHIDIDRSDNMLIKPVLNYLTDDGEIRINRRLSKQDLAKLLSEDQPLQRVRVLTKEGDDGSQRLMVVSNSFGSRGSPFREGMMEQKVKEGQKTLVFKPPPNKMISNLSVSFNIQ